MPDRVAHAAFPDQSRFVLALAPLVIACLAIAFEYSGLDLAVTGHFFDPDTGSWPFRDSRLFHEVLHDRAADLTAALYVLVLSALAASFAVPGLRRWRRPLLYLAVASATGPVAVGILKATTHIYVPWHLELFGGDLPYVRMLDHAPAGLSAGHAFPGGHSSGGFAWLSVFFLLHAHARPSRWSALAAALAVGCLFSATQVVRGAHFPSHDLMSLAICWTSGVAWMSIFYPRRDAGFRGDRAIPGRSRRGVVRTRAAFGGSR